MQVQRLASERDVILSRRVTLQRMWASCMQLEAKADKYGRGKISVQVSSARRRYGYTVCSQKAPIVYGCHATRLLYTDTLRFDYDLN